MEELHEAKALLIKSYQLLVDFQDMFENPSEDYDAIEELTQKIKQYLNPPYQ